jgi:hypothetical protein
LPIAIRPKLLKIKREISEKKEMLWLGLRGLDVWSPKPTMRVNENINSSQFFCMRIKVWGKIGQRRTEKLLTRKDIVLYLWVISYFYLSNIFSCSVSLSTIALSVSFYSNFPLNATGSGLFLDLALSCESSCFISTRIPYLSSGIPHGNKSNKKLCLINYPLHWLSTIHLGSLLSNTMMEIGKL